MLLNARNVGTYILCEQVWVCVCVCACASAIVCMCMCAHLPSNWGTKRGCDACRSATADKITLFAIGAKSLKHSGQTNMQTATLPTTTYQTHRTRDIQYDTRSLHALNINNSAAELETCHKRNHNAKLPMWVSMWVPANIHVNSHIACTTAHNATQHNKANESVNERSQQQQTRCYS